MSEEGPAIVYCGVCGIAFYQGADGASRWRCRACVQLEPRPDTDEDRRQGVLADAQALRDWWEQCEREADGDDE